MSRLHGKVALITGGRQRHWSATARLFLNQGAKVIIAGRDAKKLEQAVQSLQGGDRLTWQSADVSNDDQVQKLIQGVTATHGRIDILVNNAGLNLKERTMRELTPARWRQLVDANLNGAYYCIHAVLPQMVQANKDGLIVNISSAGGKLASPAGLAAYAASKFGMTALGICLGAEEKDNGIRAQQHLSGRGGYADSQRTADAGNGGTSPADSAARRCGGRGCCLFRPCRRTSRCRN